MLTIEVAGRHTWATAGFWASFGVLLMAATWPQRAAAQDASLPGVSMLECVNTQKPRATELSQAAAAARKGSSLATGLRVRQLEGQIFNVNTSLLAVKSLDDCQKVAAQIDTVRDRLERLVPGAMAAGAAGAVAPPPQAAATPAEPAPAYAPQQQQQQPPVYTPPPVQQPQPAMQPPQQPSQDGRNYLECQVNLRQDIAAYEADLPVLRASGRLQANEMQWQTAQTAQWRTWANGALVPGQCEQLRANIATIRGNLQRRTPAASPAVAQPQAQPAAPHAPAPTAQAAPATPAPAPVAAPPQTPAPVHATAAAPVPAKVAAPPAPVHVAPSPKPAPAPAPAPAKADGCDKLKDKGKKCPHA